MLYSPSFELGSAGGDTVLTWELYDARDSEVPPVTGSATIGTYIDPWFYSAVPIAGGALLALQSTTSDGVLLNHLLRVNVFSGSVTTLLTIADTEGVGQSFEVSSSETGDRIFIRDGSTGLVVSSVNGGETWRFGDDTNTSTGYSLVTMLGDGTLLSRIIENGYPGGLCYSQDGGVSWVAYETDVGTVVPILPGGFIPITRVPVMVYIDGARYFYHVEINPTPALSPHPSVQVAFMDGYNVDNYTVVNATPLGLRIAFPDIGYDELWTPSGDVPVSVTYASSLGNELDIYERYTSDLYITDGVDLVTEFWTTKRACTEVV